MKRPESDVEKYSRHCEAIAAASAARENLYASITAKHEAETAAVEKSGGVGRLAMDDSDEGTERQGTRYDPRTGSPVWQSQDAAEEGARAASERAAREPARATQATGQAPNAPALPTTPAPTV